MSDAITDFADLPAEYLIELGSAPIAQQVRRASLGQYGAVPIGGVPRDRAAAPGGGVVVLRYSQRGWMGEPGDTVLPNVPYPPRLVDPPTITRSIRVLPEDSPRGTYQSGEVRLDNADDALDQVTGDWTLVGRPAILLRGPHRQPTRAAYVEFSRVGEFRITSPALSASGRVSIGLREAARDLAVPISTSYAGTGGIEGDAGLAGQSRPLLLGLKRNIQPVMLLALRQLYQVSNQALAQVLAVRVGGANIQFAADYATLADLLAASIPFGRYATCLALGLVRLASNPEGQVAVDAVGAGDSSHSGIARALLTGPGGLTSDRVASDTFAALPPGVAGFHWSGGTVEAALDDVLGSCSGWWSSDRFGRIVAGRLAPPEALTPILTVPRWWLTAEPSEVAGVAPRWRQRVAFRQLGFVQTLTDLVGVAQQDPAVVAALTTAQLVVTAFNTAIAQSYPSALDPNPLSTGFDQEADAQAQANMLLNLHGVRRRRWRVPVGKWGMGLDVGQAIAVDHPRLAGRTWIVIGSDEAGDAKTLTLWG